MPAQPSIESLLEKCAREPHELTVVEMPGARTLHLTGDALRDYFTRVIQQSNKAHGWNVSAMLSGLDPPNPAVPHIAAFSLKNETVEVYYDHRPGMDTAGIYIRVASASAAPPNSLPSVLELRVFQPPGTTERLVQFIVPDPAYAAPAQQFPTPDLTADHLKAFHIGLTWLKQWFQMPPVSKKKQFQLNPTQYFIPDPPTPEEAARGMYFYTRPLSLVASKKDPKVPMLNDWAARVYDILQYPVKPSPKRRSPAKRHSPAKPSAKRQSPAKKPASSSSVLMGSPVLEAPPKAPPEKKEEKKKPEPVVVAPASPEPKKPPSMSPKLELTKKSGQTQATLFKGKATLAMVSGTHETKVGCAVGGLANCFTIESLAKKPQTYSVSPRNTALYNLLNTLMDAKSGLLFQGVYLISSLNLILVEGKKATVPKARPEYSVFEVKKSGKDMNYSPQPSITVRKA